MDAVRTADDLRDVELLDTTDAAEALRLSVSRTLQLADAGVLKSKRTKRGRRVFLLPDVQSFARTRLTMPGRRREPVLA
jgi:hypothetical protein